MRLLRRAAVEDLLAELGSRGRSPDLRDVVIVDEDGHELGAIVAVEATASRLELRLDHDCGDEW